jgi:hypothetical protein
LLLICYDESWPAYLAPSQGQPAFASALVLAAGRVEHCIARIGRPQAGNTAFEPAWKSEACLMPALAAIPLLEWVANSRPTQPMAISPTAPGWQIQVDAS